jgi:ABC-type Fe3+-hydroxamate transport system substrate-binding protein
MRVVSLVPSVTETLLAWGIVPAAVTRFCEHPELPNVGGTKNPDVPAIVALAPDLVVMDDDENRKEDAGALEQAGVSVHATHVRSLADLADSLAALAAAVGVVASTVAPAIAPGAEPVPTARRRAFVPIWRRPWMTFNRDTYAAALLAVVGIDTVFAAHADRFPTVTLEEAAATAPDLVLAPSEPYPFAARHAAELRAVAAEVRLVDGQDLFWWGARTPAAIERLRAELG